VDELWGESYVWVFSLVFTYLMLQFTEILPKTLGVRYRQKMAKHGAYPLTWGVKLLAPFINLIRLINKPFEPAKKGREEGVGAVADEINALASAARMANQIGMHQEKIILTATHLAGISASQVMIPAAEVMSFTTKNTIQEAFLMAHTDLHTRYPVRDAEQPDRVVGYVNFKELVYFMSTNPNDPSLHGIVRPINSIRPDANANELLKMFVDQYNHMMVVQEPGGPALGIVTLEDVIEEMVGEIEDEFDRLPQYIHSLSSGVFLAGGGAELAQVASRIGESLPGEEGETIGGWLASKLGPHFNRGDFVRAGLYEIAVRRIKRGKIFDVAITDMPADADRTGCAASTTGE
ncbi:MAG: CNNM domain-containing protein, partial [Planctomycetes bacterium]|nr:CNNM domain-containing protein [Planctomycetota bacterium]